MQALLKKKFTMWGEKSIKYGYLYNWYVTKGTSSIIPADMDSLGWRLPTVFELLDFDKDGGTDFVLLAKCKSLLFWNTPNNNAENKHKMNLMPSGTRNGSSGQFADIGVYCYFISSYSHMGFYAAVKHNAVTSYLQGDSNYRQAYTFRFFRPANTTEQTYSDGTYCDPYIGNDGWKYKTVKIGTKVWMSENLAETKYRDGSDIPNVTDNAAWAALTTGARCAYDNNESNVFMQ
jgi:hypothetical protein